MKILNNFLKSVLLLSVLGACQNKPQKTTEEQPQEPSTTKLTLTNQSAKNLSDKAIIIERGVLGKIDGALYPVITSGGKEIPSQLDDTNKDGQWDQLFLVANLPANGALDCELSWTEKKPEYEARTNVRFGKRDSKNGKVTRRTSDTLMADKVQKALGYQPYQTDGPMWENDKAGFRHYFDGRNANDFYGKKVSYLTPDTVGIGSNGEVYDNYHVMADWGRDVLSVGNSAGIGGFELMVNDKITRLGITNEDTLNNIEQTVFNVVANGPVRSIMNFDYQNWQVGDRMYTANETTKIWPGMYAYQNTVSISGLQGDETLLVGLVNSNTDKDLVEYEVGDFTILYTHDKQTYDKVWYLGLAILLPKTSYLGQGEAPEEGTFSKSFYGKLKIKNNSPVSYYAVGCWELADKGFTDEAYFKNYLTDLAEQLSAKVKVTIQ